jgi:hypothetical protein
MAVLSAVLCLLVELTALEIFQPLLLKKYIIIANIITMANTPVPALTPAFAPGVKADEEGLTG